MLLDRGVKNFSRVSTVAVWMDGEEADQILILGPSMTKRLFLCYLQKSNPVLDGSRVGKPRAG